MGVEHTKRFVLLRHIDDQPGQHGVLEDIGEVSGVVDVTVIHSRPLRPDEKMEWMVKGTVRPFRDAI